MLCIAWALLIMSCKQKTPQTYMSELESNEGLHRVVNAGGITYTFNILPPEAMAYKDSYDPERKVLDRTHYKNRIQELNSFIYVKIDHKVTDRSIAVLKFNSSSNAEYEQRVKYYEFHAAQDIRMICNGKEVAPVSYQYENHHDLSPVNSLMVAFPKCSEGEQWQITFNDRGMNNLFIKAAFLSKDISDLPPMVLNY